jgi:hypothetical protein
MDLQNTNKGLTILFLIGISSQDDVFKGRKFIDIREGTDR